MTTTKASCTSDPTPCENPSKDQYLFLLEFYVRQICSSRLARLNTMFCVPTAVKFKFLDFTMDCDLVVNPVDRCFEPVQGGADQVEYFNAGKSVLFALSDGVVKNACQQFRIKICVVKPMLAEFKPDVMVGSGELNLDKEFAALRMELLQKLRYNNVDSPNPSQTFDDVVPLSNLDGCNTGTIELFVRVSAHDQIVVTEFDAKKLLSAPDRSSRDDNNPYDSFIFKAAEPITCDDDDDDVYNPECNKILKYRFQRFDPVDCTSSVMIDDENEDGDYNRGRSKCSFCAKKTKEKSNRCDDDFGNKKNSCCSIVEPEEACSLKKPVCTPIQSSRGPKQPCGKAVVLKVSGLLNCGEGDNKEARVTVAPESEGIKPEDMVKDSEHDVFVLRIGKKGIVGAGEKSDIQLEMRTPKGPQRGPPVRLETREIQTEDESKSGKKPGGKGKKK